MNSDCESINDEELAFDLLEKVLEGDSNTSKIIKEVRRLTETINKGMYLEEETDLGRVNGLINSFEEINEFLKYNPQELKNLKKYLKNFTDAGSKSINQKYTMKKYTDSVGKVHYFGRFYNINFRKKKEMTPEEENDNNFKENYKQSGNGIICLKREFKNYISMNIYIDCDMESCFFRIIEALCVDFGLDKEDINKMIYYNNNRSIEIEKMMKDLGIKTKNDIKILLTSCIHDQNFNKYEKYTFKFDDESKNYTINLNKETKYLKFFNEIVFEKLYNKLQEYSEWKSFSEFHKKKNEKEIEKCKKNKEKSPFINYKGSTMGNFYQTIESAIMITSKAFMILKNIKIGTYEYDGFKVYKNQEMDLEKTLNELNEYIYNNMNIRVKFVNKKMEYPDILDTIKINPIEIDPDSNYYKWKEEFEKKIFFVENVTKYMILTDNENYNFRTDNELKKIYYNHEDVYKFVARWILDRKKKKYESIDFLPYPLKCKKTKYNMFQGFEIEKVESNIIMENGLNSVEVFKELIDHICFEKNNTFEENKKSSDYLLKWIAHMIQMPGEKNGVYVVIHGQQGSGKGTLYSFLEGLINNYAFQTSNSDHVFGRFNDVIQNKILINLDEALSKKLFEDDGKLKNLVTEKTINIETKGIPVKSTISSCHRILVTTNQKNPGNFDNARRPIALNPEKISKDLKNKIYKKNKIILNENNFKSIFDYLLTINLSEINWQEDRPINNAYNELVEKQYHMEYIWLYNFSRDNDNKKIENNDIYLSYENYTLNQQFKLGKRQFSIFISKIIRDYPELITRNKEGKNCTHKYFNFKKIKKYLKDESLFDIKDEEETDLENLEIEEVEVKINNKKN